VNSGCHFIDQNFTCRGGELDLVVKKTDITVFVEVKVVDSLEDVHGVVTPKKCHTLQRTIARYMQRNPVVGDIRVDLVFVAKGRIIEHLENIIL